MKDYIPHNNLRNHLTQATSNAILISIWKTSLNTWLTNSNQPQIMQYSIMDFFIGYNEGGIRYNSRKRWADYRLLFYLARMSAPLSGLGPTAH
jgi:hypothetical protein